MMKTLRNSILIGITAFGIASAGIAADQNTASASATAGCHPGLIGRFSQFADGKWAEHMQARMEKKLTELHDKLQLLPVQEPAWTTFIAAIKPADRPDAAARAAMRAELEKLSAPERMEKMLTQLKLQETLLGTKLEALKTFYAALSPAQQKIFNDNFKAPPHGPALGEHFGHGN